MKEDMIYNQDIFQLRKETLEKILKIINKRNDTISYEYLFFGDSLIENMPGSWSATNNGIGGMTSCMLKHIIDEVVIKFNPEKVYLHIGTNDLGETVMASPRTIALNVKTIFDVLIRNLPNTKFYLISTLPNIDEKDSMYSLGRGIRMNDLHDVLNNEFKIHLSTMNVEFIDLNSFLRNEDGSVKIEYYEDGLHLNQEGYEYLRNISKKNKIIQ